METLEELYHEVEKRIYDLNIVDTDSMMGILWTVIAEQPLHIQYRLINKALDKHQAPSVCNHPRCSRHVCHKKPSHAPQESIEEPEPVQTTMTQKRKRTILSFVLKLIHGS